MPSGKYLSQLSPQSVTVYFVFMNFVWFSQQTLIVSLNSINQLSCLIVKSGVLFEVRIEFLNVLETRFGLKGLKLFCLVSDIKTILKYKCK
jgi:hypothetical protein